MKKSFPPSLLMKGSASEKTPEKGATCASLQWPPRSVDTTIVQNWNVGVLRMK